MCNISKSTHCFSLYTVSDNTHIHTQRQHGQSFKPIVVIDEIHIMSKVHKTEKHFSDKTIILTLSQFSLLV